MVERAERATFLELAEIPLVTLVIFISFIEKNIIKYSAHPNRRTCTFIYFEQKIHPIRSYLGRVRLFNSEKNFGQFDWHSENTSKNGFNKRILQQSHKLTIENVYFVSLVPSSKMLLSWAFSTLYVYSDPVRLLHFPEITPSTIIQDCTSIRVRRVFR